MKLYVTPVTGKLSLVIQNLTHAQVEFIRCMMEIDYEVDPVKEWGFKKSDGNLNNFRLNVANKLNKLGY